MKTEKLTEYEIKRNALIPDAEKYADKIAGFEPAHKKSKEHTDWEIKWNQAFHSKMKELAKSL